MKSKLLPFLAILAISCSQDNYKDVGAIPFDASIDKGDFKICNEKNIKQYYIRRSSDTAPRYEGEKKVLDKAILDRYEYPEKEDVNGYLTIRFIVNCHGETGRFRIEEMNVDYQTIQFDRKISNQLLDITKKLKGWIPRQSNGKNVDFYQYLTFKIRKGQIVKILP